MNKTLMALCLLISTFLITQAGAEVPEEYLKLAAKLEKVESKLHLETPTFDEVDFLQQQIGGNVENIFLHARMNQVELHLRVRDKLAKKIIRNPASMFGAYSYGMLFNRMAQVEKYLKLKKIQQQRDELKNNDKSKNIILAKARKQ